MPKSGSNPWDNALVWFTENLESSWRPGKVIRLEVSPTREWSFIIEECNGKWVEITTVPTDSFGLEFILVKKRSNDGSSMVGVTDMTSLSFLNEPEMIECLRMRYDNKRIYTSIGPILIAINPFEQLGPSVYSHDTIESYDGADQLQSRQLGPHVYQISSSAYQRMLVDKYNPDSRENQCILVNGESGAGKTESTKHVLRFLTTNSSKLAAEVDAEDTLVNDIERLINAVNPVTESFGNAKTSRNNNSSRFGKFIELCYATDGYIDGAHIQTYLLETIRVTAQLPGERNFHIFYEVFAGMSQEQRQAWDCQSLQGFRFLNQSGEYRRHDGETDEENFVRLREALVTIRIPPDRVREICQLVVAIMHIGNITFDSSEIVGEDAAVFSAVSKTHVQSVCQLLQIEDNILLSAVGRRSIRVAGSVIEKNLTVDAAVNARDIFARTTYDLLFRSLLQQINRCLRLDDSREEAASFIGVLDIFGFEYFENNSFEQLCINYANEKLQDHFNYAIFKSEQEVYQEEGIKWVFKDYPDNAERLELFEHKRTGLFLLCDEQLKIPKPEDDKLVKSFYAKCTSHKFFSASRGDKGKQDFVVNHFACDVKYNISGFVDKNRNEIAAEIYAAFDSSLSSYVQSLPSATDDPNAKRAIKEADKHRVESWDEADMPVERSAKLPRAAGVSVGRKNSSVASAFSAQLSDLIAKIRSTRSHFIRCIKPNNMLLPNSFDYGMVMSQLRCGGALGAVQVFRAGFPNRMDFKYFVTRYSAFFVVCGVNALTKDLQECILRARQSDSDDLWRVSSTMLVDIVSLTAIVLNMTEQDEALQDVDVLNGLQRGKTQVFIRAPVFELLERLHLRSLTLIAKRLQRRFREIKARHDRRRPSAKSIAANSVMYVAYKRRFQARKCVSAILLLQRRVRVYLTVCVRLRVIAGFTRLKAVFRGGKAREFVQGVRRRAAIKIQTLFRSFRAHKTYGDMVWAVVRVQTMVRCWRAWRQRAQIMHLCRTLQRLWRGRRCRLESQNYRQKMKRDAAEAEVREAEAKAGLMCTVEEMLKCNPNQLSDWLGAMDRIAQLEKQNDALMQSNRMLKAENSDLRSSVGRLTVELSDAKRAAATTSVRRPVDHLSVRNIASSIDPNAVTVLVRTEVAQRRSEVSRTTASGNTPGHTEPEILRGQPSKSVARKKTVPPLVSLLSCIEDDADSDSALRLSTPVSSLSSFPSRPTRPPSVEMGNVKQWWQYAACMAAGKILVHNSGKSNHQDSFAPPRTSLRMVRGGKSRHQSAARIEATSAESLWSDAGGDPSSLAYRTPERSDRPQRLSRARVVKPESHRSTLVSKRPDGPQKRGESGLLLPSSAFAKYLAGSITSPNASPEKSPVISDPVTPVRSPDGNPKTYTSQRSESGLLIPSPQLAKYINASNRQSSL